MKRYTAQQPAPYGLYLSARPLDLRFVGAEDEPLAGRDGASYRRIPTLLVVLLGPALGAAFVLAFPLVLAAVLVGFAVSAISRGVSAHRHAFVARTRWQPAASYFEARTDAPRAPKFHDDDPDGFAALEAEVARRAEIEKRNG